MADAYSVSQVNSYINNMFRTDFLLGAITVFGEVSNCKYHSSGHIYFTMKDKGSSLACVMFAGDRGGLKFNMSEGMKIKAFGSISVYERDGKYQLYAKRIEKEGKGDLYAKFLALKQELEDMGMFDACYKKPIPRFVKKVGVVTASTGAAIQDIINITKRRNPYVQLYLYPAKVQGDGAARTVCDGIEYLDRMGLDVIIVGRGGGSIEDLWAFNEEIVARAIFNARTPIISAVGHETDYTIADFVSDLRAPTPSAAAELAVFDYSDFVERLDAFKNRYGKAFKISLGVWEMRLEGLRGRLSVASPQKRLSDNRQYLDRLSDKLGYAMNFMLSEQKNKLMLYAQKLKGLSPLDRISSGFAFVSDKDGKNVKSVSDVNVGDELSVYLRDGMLTAVIKDKE